MTEESAHGSDDQHHYHAENDDIDDDDDDDDAFLPPGFVPGAEYDDPAALLSMEYDIETDNDDDIDDDIEDDEGSILVDFEHFQQQQQQHHQHHSNANDSLLLWNNNNNNNNDLLISSKASVEEPILTVPDDDKCHSCSSRSPSNSRVADLPPLDTPRCIDSSHHESLAFTAGSSDSSSDGGAVTSTPASAKRLESRRRRRHSTMAAVPVASCSSSVAVVAAVAVAPHTVTTSTTMTTMSTTTTTTTSRRSSAAAAQARSERLLFHCKLNLLSAELDADIQAGTRLLVQQHQQHCNHDEEEEETNCAITTTMTKSPVPTDPVIAPSSPVSPSLLVTVLPSRSSSFVDTVHSPPQQQQHHCDDMAALHAELQLANETIHHLSLQQRQHTHHTNESYVKHLQRRLGQLNESDDDNDDDDENESVQKNDESETVSTWNGSQNHNHNAHCPSYYVKSLQRRLGEPNGRDDKENDEPVVYDTLASSGSSESGVHNENDPESVPPLTTITATVKPETNGRSSQQIIRSLQRRMGYLEQRSSSSRESHLISEVATLRERNSQLELELSAVLMREDQLKEEIVQSMTLAKEQVEQLQRVHEFAIRHFKEQYERVEEELFEALEREDEANEERDYRMEQHANEMQSLQLLLDTAALTRRSSESAALTRANDAEATTGIRRGEPEKNTSVVGIETNHLSSSINAANQTQSKNAAARTVPAVAALGSTMVATTALQSPTSAFTRYSDDSKARIPNVEPDKGGECDPLEQTVRVSQTRHDLRQCHLVFDNSDQGHVPVDTDESTESELLNAMDRVSCTPSAAEELSFRSTTSPPLLCASTEAPLLEPLVSPIPKHAASTATLLNFSTPIRQPTPRLVVVGSTGSTANAFMVASPLASSSSHNAATGTSEKISEAKAKLRSLESIRLRNGVPSTNTESVSVSRRVSAVSKASHTIPTGISSGLPRPAVSKATTGRVNRPSASLQRPERRSGLPQPSTRTSLLPRIAAPSTRLSATSKGSKSNLAKAKPSPRPTVLGTVSPNIPIHRGTTPRNKTHFECAILSPKSRLAHSAHSRQSSLPKSKCVRMPSNVPTSNTEYTNISPPSQAEPNDLFRKLSKLNAQSSTPLISRSARSEVILSSQKSTVGDLPSSLKFRPSRTKALEGIVKTIDSLLSPGMPVLENAAFTPSKDQTEFMLTSSPDSPLVTPARSLRCKGSQNVNRPMESSKAVFVIQTAWRKQLWRKCAARRRHESSRKKFDALEDQRRKVDAVTLIQKHFRQYIQKRDLRTILHFRSRGATIIQAASRGSVEAKRYSRLRRARKTIAAFVSAVIMQWKSKQALRIQRNFRMIPQRRKYCSIRRSIIFIQNWWKGERKRSNTKNGLLRASAALYIHLQASRIIQCCFRRYLQRLHRHTLTSSLLRLQCNLRMVLCRKKYSDIRRAARFMQCQIREKRLSSRIHRRTKRTGSAVLVQRYVRMRLCHDEYKTRYCSVVSIQCQFRRQQLRVRVHQRLKESLNLVRVQSIFRMGLCRKKYVVCRGAVVSLQCMFRQTLALSRLQQLNKERNADSVVQLQKVFRTWLCRRQYISVRGSVALIQRMARRELERKKVRQNNAAIQIQRAIRMRLNCRHYSSFRKAVVSLQRLSRQRISLKRVEKDLQRAVTYATCIQRNMRQRRCRRKFVACRNASICVQRFCRGNLLRSRIQKHGTAALQIQNQFRMRRHRRHFKLARRKVLFLQRRIRAMLDSRSEQKVRLCAAVIRVQCRWRMIQIRKRHRTTVRGVLLFQSSYRRYTSKQKERVALESVICLQSFARMISVKYWLARITNSALKIQAQVRGGIRRLQSSRGRDAAVRIQAWSRMIVSSVRYKLLLKRTSLLQAKWKYTFNHRRRRKASATVRIQSFQRAVVLRRSFLKVLRTAVQLQAAVRLYLAKQRMCNIRRYAKCATLIQSCVRMSKVRREVKLVGDAACLIQRSFRQTIANRLAADQKSARDAVVLLQSLGRMLSIRNEYDALCRASVSVQSTIRGYLDRKGSTGEAWRARKVMVVLIQRNWRMKVHSTLFSRLQRATIKIQAWSRCCICSLRFRAIAHACNLIQTKWRSFHLNDLILTKIRSSVLLQAIVRGFIIKRRLKRTMLKNTANVQLLKTTNRSLGKVNVPVPPPITTRKVLGNISVGELTKQPKRPALGLSAHISPSHISSRRSNRTNSFRSGDENSMMSENLTPPNSNKGGRVALSAKRLSTAIKLASQASALEGKDDSSTSLRLAIGKLKVIELREELKTLGVESRCYSKLRKAELIDLVVRTRESVV